jgi:hypothetical protein
MPEAAIQVIREDQFPAMEQLMEADVRKLAKGMAEHRLPFTHVNKSFVGNRYGEYRHTIPATRISRARSTRSLCASPIATSTAV